MPAAGYELDHLRVEGLDRGNPLRALRAVVRAGLAVPASRRVLRARGAQAVMGAGGYVSGPAGLAAVTSGLPLVLSEADSHLGLTNRLLARRARRICLAFPILGRTGSRYLVTGRPVPRAVLDADREAARARFGLSAEERCLLVFGGSQGARSLNLAAVDAFATNRGEPDFHVLHIAGTRDFGELRARLERLAPERYTLLASEPHLGDVLAASDLVVARSGGSIFEIAAAGRPAILVPYPHASGDHQRRNAQWMASAGAARVIDDDKLTPERLGGEVAGLLGAPSELARMARESSSLARPDAAERIAEEVLAAAEARPGGPG